MVQSKQPHASRINTQPNGIDEQPSTSKRLTVNRSTNENLEVNSKDVGLSVFKHIISGIDYAKFMNMNWEKEPVYIERDSAAHYSSFGVSTNAIDEMLRTNVIEFTKNVDVTSYENGVRETYNPGW